METIDLRKGTIVVVTVEQQTSCGIKYLYEGSIVKVKEMPSPWSDDVKVYRNKKAEEHEHYHYLDKSECRFANDCERDAYNAGIYNINKITENAI